MERIRDWQLNAKCLDEDTSYFFPEKGKESRKGYCTGCPVINQCKTYAIAHDEDGVWGGTSKYERDKMPAIIIEAIRDLYYKEGLLEFRPGVVQEFLELRAVSLQVQFVPIVVMVPDTDSILDLVDAELLTYTSRNSA